MRTRLCGGLLAAMMMWGAAAMDLESVEQRSAWEAYAAIDGDCDDDAADTPVVARTRVMINGAANLVTAARWTDGYVRDSSKPRGFDPTRTGSFKSTSSEPQVAALFFHVMPTEKSKLTIKLDIDDAWNNTYETDDFLEEIYFTFDDIACTGFGVKVGKMEVPFGYDKDVLLLSPYLHSAVGETNFNRRHNGFPAYSNTGLTSPIGGTYPNGTANAYGEHNAAEYDNMFALTPYYSFCDGQLLLEASLFQAKRDIGNRRRSNDNLLFKSGALRATWRPIENLMIQASFIARYNDYSKSVGDEDRMYATSVAADYTFQLCGREMNVFGEWQHTWNSYQDSNGFVGTARRFRDNSSSDDIHFGLRYKILEKVRLNLQGEWLAMRNDRRNTVFTNDADSTMWRALVALEYDHGNGMVSEFGYQKEWLKLDNVAANYGPGAKSRFDAHTLYSGLKFSF